MPDLVLRSLAEVIIIKIILLLVMGQMDSDIHYVVGVSFD